MLKYVDTKVTFSEVPNEISLCINISNCFYSKARQTEVSKSIYSKSIK